MAKKNPRAKRLTRTARAQILAEMNSKGLTANQVARKYGISAWTVYGWRKSNSPSSNPATRGRKTGRPAIGSSVGSGITTAALRDEIRAILPTILSEEIASALRGMIGAGAKRRGRRGGKK